MSDQSGKRIKESRRDREAKKLDKQKKSKGTKVQKRGRNHFDDDDFDAEQYYNI